MKTLRFILGDQLSRSVSSLQDVDVDNDVVLMVEVRDETTYVKHHKHKIALVLSAMRHFAESLRREGLRVDYVRLDDEGNTGSFTGEVERALSRHEVDRVCVTRPGEWRVWEMVQSWSDLFEVDVDFREDDRFLCSEDEFAEWAEGRKSFRMEFFYREMRRKTGWLMKGDEPEGGQWNYDAENREALPKEISIASREPFAPDEITTDVLSLVEERFSDHIGELSTFGWAVTREDALKALAFFVDECLQRFGTYQDAMKTGDSFLFHSMLSPYLNVGLLVPGEVCEAALSAYAKGSAPLPAVEGFVRQILGWREYLRGIYWLKMPAYADSNFFNARRPLPAFYWTADTTMNCMKEAIDSTRQHAYAHHIQRLMITGNFALLAGIAPAEVEEWYLAVYADAFEWVELPNTHGMALYAGGGLLASKPYAASGSYINRMSDYCNGCKFNPKTKLGEGACPFNYLYWYFLIANQERLKANPRMALPYRTLSRMSSERKTQIVHDAEEFLDSICA